MQSWKGHHQGKLKQNLLIKNAIKHKKWKQWTTPRILTKINANPPSWVFNRVLSWQIKCFCHYHPLKLLLKTLGRKKEETFDRILFFLDDLTCLRVQNSWKKLSFSRNWIFVERERDVMTRKRTLKWKKKRILSI